MYAYKHTMSRTFWSPYMHLQHMCMYVGIYAFIRGLIKFSSWGSRWAGKESSVTVTVTVPDSLNACTAKVMQHTFLLHRQGDATHIPVAPPRRCNTHSCCTAKAMQHTFLLHRQGVIPWQRDMSQFVLSWCRYVRMCTRTHTHTYITWLQAPFSSTYDPHTNSQTWSASRT